MANKPKQNLHLFAKGDGSFAIKLDEGDVEALGPLLRGNRLLKIGAVLEMTGLSRSRVYDLLGKKLFPQPVKEGNSNLWSETEVQRWIAEKLAKGKAADPA